MAGLAAIGIGGLLLHQLLKDGDEPEPPPEGDFSSITAIFA